MRLGTHWVVEVAGEAIDLSARQFDEKEPLVLREPLSEAAARWVHHDVVDPDHPTVWSGVVRFDWDIPGHWRQLLDADPPGHLPRWPYPGD